MYVYFMVEMERYDNGAVDIFIEIALILDSVNMNILICSCNL